jgi:hypothetical protein
MPPWGRSLILVTALAGLMAFSSFAAAETQGLEAGQPAPARGIWIDDQAAERAAQDLDQARKTAAELEDTTAILAARATQVEDLVKLVAELKAAVQNLQGQVATSAQLDEVRIRTDEINTKALKLASDALDTQGKINDANLGSFVAVNKALGICSEENARLLHRGIWDNVQSVLFGLAAFFAGRVL